MDTTATRGRVTKDSPLILTDKRAAVAREKSDYPEDAVVLEAIKNGHTITVRTGAGIVPANDFAFVQVIINGKTLYPVREVVEKECMPAGTQLLLDTTVIKDAGLFPHFDKLHSKPPTNQIFDSLTDKPV